MNREILFRGKRADNGEWVYGFLVCMNYIDVFIQKVCYDGQEEIRYCTVEHYQVDTNTVGQFTGLCDKNGNKIFEGDIVCVRHKDSNICFLGDVQFEYGVFGIEWTANKKDKSLVGFFGQKHNLKRFDDGVLEYIEVIGNIHNNPELLEVQNDTL